MQGMRYLLEEQRLSKLLGWISVTMTSRNGRLAAVATALSCTLLASPIIVEADDIPTPEEYVAHVGGDAHIVPMGEFKLDGIPQTCGRRPTVVDSQLDDYGAAYPGFLIMNPKLLNRVSTPVKLWIYAHECGHQFRGRTKRRPTASRFSAGAGRDGSIRRVSKRSASSSRRRRATACTSRVRTGANTCASASPIPRSSRVAASVIGRMAGYASRRKTATLTRPPRSSLGRGSGFVFRREETLGFECCHAAHARSRHGLAEDVVLHIACSEHARIEVAVESGLVMR